MKILLVLTMTMLVSFGNPNDNEKIRIKNFEIEVPEELTQVTTREKYNELLSLRYRDELKILITDDIGSTLKPEERKDIYNKLDLFTDTFEIKYDGYYQSYKGLEKGVLRKDNINSFEARTRDFKSNINGMIIYFEISTINIGNYYFDFIITGKEASRASHKSIVNEFLNSIKKISEN